VSATACGQTTEEEVEHKQCTSTHLEEAGDAETLQQSGQRQLQPLCQGSRVYVPRRRRGRRARSWRSSKRQRI